jgi:hypothetical protein
MSQHSFKWNEEYSSCVLTKSSGEKIVLFSEHRHNETNALIRDGSMFMIPKGEYGLCDSAVSKGSCMKYPKCGLEACPFCAFQEGRPPPRDGYDLCLLKDIGSTGSEPDRLFYYIWSGDSWKGHKFGIFMKRFSYWLQPSRNPRNYDMLRFISPEELEAVKQSKEEVDAANIKAEEAYERGVGLGSILVVDCPSE